MDDQAARAARDARYLRPLATRRNPTPPNYALVVAGLTRAELERELASVRDPTPRSIGVGYVEAIKAEARKRGIA